MAVKRTALGKRKRSPPAAMSSKKLQAQVRQLMRMRQEKKYFDSIDPGSLTVAQFNAAVAGAHVQDITPAIAQGDGEGQRIGNSLTSTGMVVKQQFIKQEFAIGPRRIRTHIVRILDPSMSAGDVLTALLDVNIFSGVRDYFSELNYAMMRDKRVQILATKETKLLANATDSSTTANERATGEMTIPVKFDDQTVRYQADGDLLPANIRYYTVTVSDIGNESTTTDSSFGFVKTQKSGVEMKYSSRFWYTDS